MKKILQLVTLFFITVSFAQNKDVPNYKFEMSQPNSNFHTITNAVKPILEENEKNAVTAVEKKNAEKALKQFGRWQYFWQDRIAPDGSFTQTSGDDILTTLKPNTKLSANVNTSLKNQNANSQKSSALTWEQVGPTTTPLAHGYVAYPGQGLVNVIKTLSGTQALAGTSNGGIWKTNDITVANPAWSPKTDFLARIGIVDIKVASNGDIYALTGDRDSSAGRSKSIGVIKSTDNGDTWSTTILVLDPTQVTYITNLGMKPNDNSKMAFVEQGAAGSNLYYTSDGWATSSNVSSPGWYVNDVLYTDDFLLVSDIFGKIYRSTDDGANFTEIYNNNEGSGNIVLRFNQTESTGDVYFLAAKKDGAKVYKLTTTEILNAAAAISATQVGTTLSTYSPQGTYNIAFSVSNTDANRMFVLGVNGWYTKDGGTNWAMKLDAYNSTTSGETYVHPDHHYVAHSSGSKWWLTHDGGIHEIDMTNYDAGSGVAVVDDKTSDLQIGQIYHSAIVPSNTSFSDALLGLQDNDGMSKSPNTQGGQWVAVQAGDGTAAAIVPSNPLIRMIGGTRGALYRTTTAYQASSNDQTSVIPANNNAPFVCKAMPHDTNSSWVFAGYTNLAVSYTSGQSFGFEPNAGGLGATVDFDVHGSRLAVIGANGQKHFDFDFALGNTSNGQTIAQPTGVSTNFNSISVNSATAGNTYATLGGYDAANKVFRSTDNGATWSNITYNLPNVVMKKVLNKVTGLGTNDEILFVATEVGVYYKVGTATTMWTKLNGAVLPNVTVTDMSINYTQDKLYAATFGRGFWSIDISTLSSTLSTEEAVLADGFKVYPVPSGNTKDVFVQLPNNSDQLNYSIYNYIGGKVSEGNVTKTRNKLNTNALSAGAYLVVFEINNTQISKKIIIN
ncbi:T9SS type A sorting domain-containing protein [Lacinutrix jangbogonensis]|uniref:T9SS type A sorting domain-containing protein n=1 Tax=Lacinutrix jangbogonensis TaxID=1469557 RepID=UPI00053DDA52|nr:T9SS type A sorting domain-containing protein [Lacinutrix jangbogonensis]